MYLISKDFILSQKCAKSLSYKEKILKKCLQCTFFLSIVGISVEKCCFVGNCLSKLRAISNSPLFKWLSVWLNFQHKNNFYSFN